MRKSETLHGHGAFRAVTTAGKRLDGTYVRSYTVAVKSTNPSLAVGVTIYDRTLNAVQRNRIRRRMRASVDLERKRLAETAAAGGVTLHVVLGYRPRKDTRGDQTPFVELHADLSRVIDGIINRIRQQWPQQ